MARGSRFNRACFACGRALGRNPALADTRDGQTAFVGTECYKLIQKAGEEGYQPPQGGPRLWCLKKGLTQQEIATKCDNAVNARSNNA